MRKGVKVPSNPEEFAIGILDEIPFVVTLTDTLPGKGPLELSEAIADKQSVEGAETKTGKSIGVPISAPGVSDAVPNVAVPLGVPVPESHPENPNEAAGTPLNGPI